MKTCMPHYSIAHQPVEDPENLQFHRSPLRSADPQFVAGLLSYQTSQTSYTRSPVPEVEDAPRVPTKAEEASRKCQHVQYPDYASMTCTGAVDSNLEPSDDDDTTETTSLLEMGYTVSQVKKAVIKLRNTTGNMDVTAEEVLTLILDEERQGLVEPPPGRRPYIRVISSSSIAAPTSTFLPVH